MDLLDWSRGSSSSSRGEGAEERGQRGKGVGEKRGCFHHPSVWLRLLLSLCASDGMDAEWAIWEEPSRAACAAARPDDDGRADKLLHSSPSPSSLPSHSASDSECSCRVEEHTPVTRATEPGARNDPFADG